ncbi:MAG: channel protein hemolysin family [Solirubrobacterales bacterium]|jgi:hemolysin III|nr:channel protein hemolysin family [Solirubrobacterales bacterium]
MATTIPPAPPLKPSLRGVSHQIAFFVALVLGLVLVVRAPRGEATTVAAIYATGVCGLFGISALYHRRTWATDRARAWMRRLDHSMIFVFIAATYTPVAVLAMTGTLGTAILAVVWGGALGGVTLSMAWPAAPKWLTAIVYVALGWVAVAAMPQLWDNLGPWSVAGLATGGLLYTLGAVVYARGRPDPRPEVFGYHEIFHAFVIVAAATHYVVIAFAVLPAAD